MRYLHYDEARAAAVSILQAWIAASPEVERAVLVIDLFGKLRIVAWGPPDLTERALDVARPLLAEKCRNWWTGDTLVVPPSPTSSIWAITWQDGRPISSDARLRIVERHRTRTAWFADVADPLWEVDDKKPPIVAFYSFKGGFGRSTTLAAFALQRARSGERVCVIDFDLEAPGIGRLLSADHTGLISPWGVVDYLLERHETTVPLADYHHSCNRLSGAGELIVFPCGRLDEQYIDKLARVDLEERPSAADSNITRLLHDVAARIRPNWILLDTRTGVSEPAGQLLSGIAHLHVLFGTTSDQSWEGLRTVIDRLGRQRVLADRGQAEVLLIQALVPASGDAARHAIESFSERAREEFSALYYAEAPEDPANEQFWDMRDIESEDAPHSSVPIHYNPRFADFGDLADIADDLAQSKDHLTVGARITARFLEEPES